MAKYRLYKKPGGSYTVVTVVGELGMGGKRIVTVAQGLSSLPEAVEAAGKDAAVWRKLHGPAKDSAGKERVAQ